jgi:multidrug efflux pump subunit AcrB
VGERTWTLASIVAAFVVSLIFAPALADLLFRVLSPLQLLPWRPSFTRTGQVLFAAFYWLYQLVLSVLTSPAHLALLLALSLVLMAFRVARR